MAVTEHIVVDSNYFIALFNPTDSLTKSVLAITEQLVQQETVLVISSFTFSETVTVLSQKSGRDIGRAAGKYLLSNPQVRIVCIDSFFQEQTWKIFQQVDHKNISFVDCSLIALMQVERIGTLLTFDITDFKKLQKQFHFSLYPIQ